MTATNCAVLPVRMPQPWTLAAFSVTTSMGKMLLERAGGMALMISVEDG
jgi:hypothetical protein